MPQVIKSLLASKKFLSFVVTLVVLVLTRKVGLDEASATELGRQIVAVAASLIVGQGVADHGKEAAATKAESSEASWAMAMQSQSAAAARTTTVTQS